MKVFMDDGLSLELHGEFRITWMLKMTRSSETSFEDLRQIEGPRG